MRGEKAFDTGLRAEVKDSRKERFAGVALA